MKHCRLKRLLFLLLLFLLTDGMPGGERKYVPQLSECSLKDVTVTPRWPWNGKVDITYRAEIPERVIDSEGSPGKLSAEINGYGVAVSGRDLVRNRVVPMTSLTGDGIDTPLTKSGLYHIVWDAGKDAPNFNTTKFVVTMTRNVYLVVNLVDGSHHYSFLAPDLSKDACRTTELWLSWIPAGTFTMGSPKDELGVLWGYFRNEVQHSVTLTQGYWMGVFEVTHEQYELITGWWDGDYTCPQVRVSYDDIRGTNLGAGWPAGGHAVDADSFIGKLRAKTGLEFDLPTEAQWEYACRAGTTTALNSGMNLTALGECPNMAEVGRYWFNRFDGRGGYDEYTKVGCYLPNARGLYDMHGNVWEWCLDWYGDYPSEAVTDPQGAEEVDEDGQRVCRGGSYSSLHPDPTYKLAAMYCRSASRSSESLSRCELEHESKSIGFRLVCPP